MGNDGLLYLPVPVYSQENKIRHTGQSAVLL
jgi:hypothetical protein